MNVNSGTLGKYKLDGTPVNTSLISGFFGSAGIAVSGSNLFVLGSDTIRKYTTNGQEVNAALITGLDSPFALEVSGSDLFVSTGSNTIAKYTTSGALVNPSLITGLVLRRALPFRERICSLQTMNAARSAITRPPEKRSMHRFYQGWTLRSTSESQDRPIYPEYGSRTIGEYATSGASSEPLVGHGFERVRQGHCRGSGAVGISVPSCWRRRPTQFQRSPPEDVSGRKREMAAHTP